MEEGRGWGGATMGGSRIERGSMIEDRGSREEGGRIEEGGSGRGEAPGSRIEVG